MVAGTLLAGTGRLRENQQPFGLQPVLPIMAVLAAATLIQLIGQFFDPRSGVVGCVAVTVPAGKSLTIPMVLRGHVH